MFVIKHLYVMFLRNLTGGGRRLLFTSVLSLMAMSVMAQSSKQVTGKVVDNNGQPIVGAAVVVDGTTTGTVTDIDGNYSLNVPEGASLSVSFVGYNKETKPADGT